MLVRSMSASLALLAVGAACRDTPKSDPIPPSVPGSYVYAAKGATLNKLQWQFAATLDLKPDGTFVIALDKTMNGKADSTERTNGTYSVSDGKVWLRGREEGKSREEHHALLIRPDSLIGEIGWKTQLVLKGLGAPDPVFLRRNVSLGPTNSR